MYKCFNCGSSVVSWESDYDFQALGYETEGIAHQYICKNCGAEIWYLCRFDENDNKEKTEGDISTYL